MSVSGPGSQRHHSPAHTLYVLTAILLGVGMFWMAKADLRDVFRRTPWDLNVDYLSARAYRDNYSPFTPEGAIRSGVAIAGLSGFGHPPTTAFWALPLTGVGIRAAGWILMAVTCALFFAQVFATLRELVFGSPLATTWVIFAFVATTPFMNYHFGVGQISGLIGFFFFLGWWAARRNRDLLAGVALGAACTLKLFPGLMVLFFLVTRRWRAVGSAVAVYLVIAAVMTVRFGLSSWATFFSVQSRIADRWMGDIQNQSLHGVISRIFEPVCVPHGRVIHAAMLISFSVAALLVAAAIWCARGRTGAARTFDLSYALFATLSVVTSQWVWEHYAIIYVTPVLILAAELRARWRAAERRTPTALMACALAAVVATWMLDIHRKQVLQRTVQAGHLQDHFMLHLHDVLNWAPGLVLTALMFVVCWGGQTMPPVAPIPVLAPARHPEPAV